MEEQTLVFSNFSDIKSYQSTAMTMKTIQFTCDLCGASYTLQENLHKHLHTHIGIHLHECSLSKIHSGEKPYKCLVCSATFTLAGCLKTHSRIHSLEKPYKCEQCLTLFARKDALKRHSSLHSGGKKYTSAKFVQLRSLRQDI